MMHMHHFGEARFAAEVKLASIGPSWLPEWATRVGFACWVSDPDGRIVFVNERARALLECRPGEALGSPCHLVVRGIDTSGRGFCKPNCRVAELARRGEAIEPLVLRRRSTRADERALLIAPVPVFAPDGSGPWLVHCVHDVDRSERTAEYIDRVARRSAVPARPLPCTDVLSPREREVLDLLTQDLDAKAIARRLHVSYATVRNHVQHVLKKLRAHSVPEAVALRLLSR